MPKLTIVFVAVVVFSASKSEANYYSVSPASATNTGLYFGPGLGPVYEQVTTSTTPATTSTTPAATEFTAGVCQLFGRNCINFNFTCADYCKLGCDKLPLSALQTFRTATGDTTYPTPPCPTPILPSAEENTIVCSSAKLLCITLGVVDYCILAKQPRCAPVPVLTADKDGALCLIFGFLCRTRQVACRENCLLCPAAGSPNANGTGLVSALEGINACAQPTNPLAMVYSQTFCEEQLALCTESNVCDAYNTLCRPPKRGYQPTYSQLYFNPLDTRNYPNLANYVTP